MRRYQVLAVFALALIAMNWAAADPLGARLHCRDGQCSVSAASSWGAVVVALSMGTFLCLYRPRAESPAPSMLVGAWRRLGAFVVDFVSVLMVMAPLAAVPVLVAEAHYTAVFNWSFSRDFARPTDAVYIVSGTLVCFIAMFLYFYLHARLGRPTAGQFVFGYRVTPVAGAIPAFGRRVVLSFIGMCVWPVSLVLALSKPCRTFWWDTASDTSVTRVVGGLHVGAERGS
jgi:hypothetical protein